MSQYNQRFETLGGNIKNYMANFVASKIKWLNNACTANTYNEQVSYAKEHDLEPDFNVDRAMDIETALDYYELVKSLI